MPPLHRLVAVVSGVGLLTAPWPTLAQITPDATLGTEASLVSPGVELPSGLADLIEGGAIRGGNLFHSFLEFNVDLGQRVYFANPVGVESILSRVTGGDPSNIFGTLGVNGAAGLFLINPNGIVFGENASLDIQGSFYATTAEAIPLGDGVYSATAPEQSSLLTVDPSALFSSYLSDASGDIENRGQLAAGENLTLAGNNLDLQGQVAAGGDLTLLGNVVQIRDTVAVPFVGFAGGDLLVQGNGGVDIVALSHADSGLYSYGDMVLRSANPVGGDAHYWSGGNFRIENLDGSGGGLYSPVDPIIRASGDVFIEDYLGSSLHVLAGGAVTIGTAEITAPNPGALGIDFLQETITLSDGTIVQVDGAAQPTLDVRAGVNPAVLGTPPLEILTGFDPTTDAFFGERFVTSIPSTADITVGDVVIVAPNGLVLLTNQYQPNTDLNGGSIFVTGRGIYGNGIDARGFGEQGGAVYLDARNDVFVTNSTIQTSGAGVVGDVVINAGSTVRFDQQNRLTGVASNLAAGTEGTGGSIQITATNVEVLNGAQLRTSTRGIGNAGSISISAEGNVLLEGVNPTNGDPSGLLSRVERGATGNSGDIYLSASNLDIRNGAIITTSTSGIGDAGDIIINVRDTINLTEINPFDGRISNGIDSSVQRFGLGSGGNISITMNNLRASNGAQITSGTSGGDGGDVLINADGDVSFSGANQRTGLPSGISNNTFSSSYGDGGDIVVRASTVEVVNGASLQALTTGNGNAGNITLESGAIRISGIGSLTGLPSTLDTRAEVLSTGFGGSIRILADSLNISDGAEVTVSTLGSGNAGNITISVEGNVLLEGVKPTNGDPSGLLSRVERGATGNSGDIYLSASNLDIRNGAIITTSTSGIGDAGDIIINVRDTINLTEINPFDGRISNGIDSSVQRFGLGSGGNISITMNNLRASNGAQITSGTSGGDGGDVLINADGDVSFSGANQRTGLPSGISNNTFSSSYGDGGDIVVRASTVEVVNGASLQALTTGNGNAGNITLESGAIRISGIGSLTGLPSTLDTRAEVLSTGFGGSIRILADSLNISDGAEVTASTLGSGNAGSISIVSQDSTQVNNATIRTDAQRSSGGQINIHSRNVLFRNDSDIQTFVTSGQGGGGNITITGDFVIALEDSDILAFSADGQGGDIDLSRTTFFGQNANIASGQLSREELLALDGNDRVDVNATGGVASGQITLNDSSFIENSLTNLADVVIDTAALTAGSCIARTDESLGSFTVTGSGGLPQRPGDSAISAYPTGTVQTLATPTATHTLLEPDGVYQLPDGRLVLSRACEEG